jgi:arylsulfatase A-like enzyme
MGGRGRGARPALGNAGFAGALVLVIGLACSGTSPERERPNLFLVTIESLRTDHVGCYGYDRATTPGLDRLATEGTRYSRASAPTSWTLTSHATLLTGLYPSAHRVIEPRHRLAESYATLAETLQEAGYQCAGIVSGPFLRSAYGLQQGFEIFDDSPSSVTQEDAHGDITNPEMEARILRFLLEERDPSRPFFLFAYFWDVHYDYLPPPPYDTLFVPESAPSFDLRDYGSNPRVRPDMRPEELAYVVSQYDGEIRCTDDALGRILDTLRGRGLWENTMIAVTADHGEEFFEHGAKGHKNNLYAESMNVPLIVKWAGNAARPATDDRLTGLLDLYATLAEAAGLAAPATDGRSLTAAPRGPSDPLFQELVTTYYGRGASGRMKKAGEQWWAVQAGPYRLISVPARNVNVLFDVAADPMERAPLGPDAAPLLEERLRLLPAWQGRMRAEASRHEDAGEAELTGGEIERLRSLGYLDGGP